MRKKLNSFHMRCLRRILQIKWQDQVPDTEVLERANMNSLHTTLSERRLRWLGHVRRMDAGRIPKDLLYGELMEGQRKTGRPKLRFKDVLKRDLKNSAINLNTWESQADDRQAWRLAVKQGTAGKESRRIEHAVNKRAKRKQRSEQPQQPSAYTCSRCDRDCHSRIGLHSHSRRCR